MAIAHIQLPRPVPNLEPVPSRFQNRFPVPAILDGGTAEPPGGGDRFRNHGEGRPAPSAIDASPPGIGFPNGELSPHDAASLRIPAAPATKTPRTDPTSPTAAPAPAAIDCSRGDLSRAVGGAASADHDHSTLPRIDDRASTGRARPPPWLDASTGRVGAAIAIGSFSVAGTSALRSSGGRPRGFSTRSRSPVFTTIRAELVVRGPIHVDQRSTPPQ